MTEINSPVAWRTKLFDSEVRDIIDFLIVNLKKSIYEYYPLHKNERN